MADYNLIIPSDIAALFTEAFVEYRRTGGTDPFDAWATKTLGNALISYLQAAQLEKLRAAYKGAGIT